MIEKNYSKKSDICFAIRYTNRIKLGQPICFVCKTNDFLSQKLSKTVKYCQIRGILRHFWAIFTCVLHYLTITNKKPNNLFPLIQLFNLNQIIIHFDSSVFDIIWLFIANYVELFALLCFVLLHFTIQITSFWFVFGYRLYKFDLATNLITKTTIRQAYW